MKKLFGTDGIRGRSNTHPMTVEIAQQVGKAAAMVFNHSKGRSRIVIGKDTRLSGYMLETALASGICSMGGDVLLVGPMPTPGIAFITRSLRADAGIVISASHNAYEDNGIKFFSRTGLKLSDKKELEIEKLVLSERISSAHVPPSGIGKAFRIDDASGRYIEFVKSSFIKGVTLDGVRIALDCANGAAYKIAPAVFRELGAEVTVLNASPNGLNINERCGALHPQELSRAVVEKKADIGIALDGDADRLILVDEKGAVLDGDHVLAVCGLDLLRRGQLPGGKIAATVMSNMGLDKALAEAGGQVVRCDVGDRYVIEAMVRDNISVGGEQSGHLIFRDFATTGDALVAAFQVLNIMLRERRALSTLAKRLVKFPQVMVNLPVREKKPFDKIPRLNAEIAKTQKTLAPYGRILLRYSGTENKARLMVEGEDAGRIRKIADRLTDLLKSHLGSV